MIEKLFLIFFVATIIICAPILGRAQSASISTWADYAGNEYETIPNVTYRTANNSDLKLDLYLPRNRPKPVPTVLFIHGGGWVEGRKEQDVLLLLPYLSMGWSVINVEYRLARNSLAPAAVEDCRCALRWVTNHSKEYGFDASKIVLTGFSAGGHLALITGMLPGNSVFDHQCPTDEGVRWQKGIEPPLRVAAIVNWYGITNLPDLLAGENAKHYAIEWFGSIDKRDELAGQLSPVNNVRAGGPPVITIHGDSDDLVPYTQATSLQTALDKANIPNQLITIRGGKHGGFGRQDVLNSYSAIRDFLSKHNINSNK